VQKERLRKSVPQWLWEDRVRQLERKEYARPKRNPKNGYAHNSNVSLIFNT
jgi:hypothetical protein